MTSQIARGTVQGLLEFLDELLKRGSKPGSIIPLRTAVRQVFMSVIGASNFDSVDINTINIDEYIFRFWELTTGKYSHTSYKTYRSRIHKAIRIYKHYLSAPDWPPDLNKTKLIEFQYALRPDLTVKMRLPHNLTALEAKRLAKYVESLTNSGNASKSDVTDLPPGKHIPEIEMILKV